MEPETFTHVRELGVGIIALLLLVLTFSLSLYIYTHRAVLSVEDRDARSAAIGLCLFFGALTFRAGESWTTTVSARLGWDTPVVLHSSSMYISVLVVLLIGAFLTIRAFHDWPLWFGLISFCVSVPIIISFIGG